MRSHNCLRKIYKMVVAKKYVLTKHFEGPPKESDLKIVEEELPPLKNGGKYFIVFPFMAIRIALEGFLDETNNLDLQSVFHTFGPPGASNPKLENRGKYTHFVEFLAEAVYLSVDPYMRAYAYKLPIGATMVGTQVAKITESRNTDFPVGKHVVGKFDWRSHTISTGNTGVNTGPASHSPYIVPDFGKLPLSLALGVLGMPGNTAYFGFFEMCKPVSGETVVVTGAAGAVGSTVGQIAKIKGCRVIGITGSNEKGKYLVEKLGFDAYVNYKSDDMEEQLAKAAPEGIDCYFDNVAGEISTKIMKHMNMFGRISVCGSISSYNTDASTPPKVSCVQLHMLNNQLTMEGFQNYLYYDRSFESMSQNLQWVNEGKLRYVETMTDGFENMNKAFIEMLEGNNIGKAIVKM